MNVIKQLKIRLERLMILTAIVFAVQACSDRTQPGASECPEIVAHAQKILGELSADYKQMMKSCQNATADVRACIMEASNKKEIIKC